MLEKINLTIAVIGVFFGSLFLMALKDYLDYSATIAKNKLILYSFIDKKSPISGRSRVYKVHYEYNNQKGEVDILLKD